MENLRLAVIALLVLVTGLVAGQMFQEQVGGQPALAALSDRTYVEYWQALDKLMAARMPVVGMGILGLFVVSLLMWFQQRRSLAYGLLLAAFLLTVGEAVITVSQQEPVNQAIQRLRPDHLPTDVARYKAITVAHFRIRAVLRITAFGLVIVAALLASRRNGQLASPPLGRLA